jgi:ubiquinone biosynthesis protein UbiJ
VVGILAEEINQLQKGITEILVAIGKIEVQISQLASIAARQADTERSVILLEQSVKVAYEDIDELQKNLATFQERVERKEQAGKEDKKWLVGTLIGVAALGWQFFKTFITIK